MGASMYFNNIEIKHKYPTFARKKWSPKIPNKRDKKNHAWKKKARMHDSEIHLLN